MMALASNVACSDMLQSHSQGQLRLSTINGTTWHLAYLTYLQTFMRPGPSLAFLPIFCYNAPSATGFHTFWRNINRAHGQQQPRYYHLCCFTHIKGCCRGCQILRKGSQAKPHPRPFTWDTYGIHNKYILWSCRLIHTMCFFCGNQRVYPL